MDKELADTREVNLAQTSLQIRQLGRSDELRTRSTALIDESTRDREPMLAYKRATLDVDHDLIRNIVLIKRVLVWRMNQKAQDVALDGIVQRHHHRHRGTRLKRRTSRFFVGTFHCGCQNEVMRA